MTLLGQGLPSPAVMLFNHQIRDIMPVSNRLPIGIDNDDEYHKVIINTNKNDKDKDTFKYFVSLPIGSTVVVQHEDGGLWTHSTIEGKGNINQHDRSCHICITKTGRLVTQNGQHIKPTHISAEQYFCEQLQKHTKTDPLENILTQLKTTNCNKYYQ